MSSKSEELTPEERLLKVIQQGKAATAAASTAAVPEPPNPPVKPNVPAEKPAVTPPVEVKGEKSAKPDIPSAPAPAVSPAAASPASPTAAPASPKLKLAPSEKAKPDQTDRADVPDQVKPVSAAERGAAIGLRGVNRILLAAVIAGILIVAYDLWADRPAARAPTESDIALVDKFPQPEALPPLDVLMQKTGTRNLFLLPAPVADNKTDKADKTPKPDKPAANFKLMGVSLDSRQPEESMALIRDQASGNTYFLKTGQRLADSEFTLGPIRAESVMLKTQRGEIELR